MAFSNLWDARFEYAETKDASLAVERLVASCYPMADNAAWVRHDMALFWLTLATQNDLIDQAVAWVPFDVASGPEGWEQLYRLILSGERWAALGSSLRCLVGLVHGSRTFETLGEHPLAAKLQESCIG